MENVHSTRRMDMTGSPAVNQNKSATNLFSDTNMLHRPQDADTPANQGASDLDATIVLRYEFHAV